MRFVLLLLFIAAPLLELAVLISVGQIIGVGWTLVLVIGTALLGLFVVRLQGFTVFNRVRQSMVEGKPPVMPMFEGALLLLAGPLLILPGLIGDTIGLLLLIPPVRRVVASWMLDGGASDGKTRVEVFTNRQWSSRRQQQRRDGDRDEKAGPVIEGEYTRIDETGKNGSER